MKHLFVAALIAAGLLAGAANPSRAQEQVGVEVGDNIFWIRTLAMGATYTKEIFNRETNSIDELHLSVWLDSQPRGHIRFYGLRGQVISMVEAIRSCDEEQLEIAKRRALTLLRPIIGDASHPGIEIARHVMAVKMRCGDRVLDNSYRFRQIFQHFDSTVIRPAIQRDARLRRFREERERRDKQAAAEKQSDGTPPPEKAVEAEETAMGTAAPTRICDTYGSGFFYIPGTETCLRLSGSFQYSSIDNPSDLGGGTIVRPMGEGFMFQLPDSIDRWGFQFGFKTPIRGVPTGSLGGSYFGYGHFEGAWGSADASGSAANGVDGVSNLGLTFADVDPVSGTGFGSNAPGFGLEGSGSIDNSWVAGGFGVGRVIPFGEASTLVLKAGLYGEGLDFDASGATTLTFAGAPFQNFHQNFDYESTDRYYGLELGAEYQRRIGEKVEISFGASLSPAYHSGKGHYGLTTGSFTGSPEIVETISYDDSGVSIGAGLSVGLDYHITPNFTIGTGAEISWLPDVTAFDAAGSPNEQPAAFHKETVTRVFIDMVHVQVRF